ncbi:hypothetical protein C8R44DRAFT_946760 [Mycena epipterygia]|nr:hypothetical protein C8R44DRAFT_946760 [Mycena epipterygia]
MSRKCRCGSVQYTIICIEEYRHQLNSHRAQQRHNTVTPTLSVTNTHKNNSGFQWGHNGTSTRGRAAVSVGFVVVLARFGSVQVQGLSPRTPNLNVAFGSGNSRTLNLNARSGSVRRSNAFEPKALRPSRAAEISLKISLIKIFSALVVGKGISHAFASAETPTNDKLSSRKFARKLRDNKPSSINIEIALNLPRREGLGSAFERTCSPPNAEPNFRFRFKYSLNLNAEQNRVGQLHVLFPNAGAASEEESGRWGRRPCNLGRNSVKLLAGKNTMPCVPEKMRLGIPASFGPGKSLISYFSLLALNARVDSVADGPALHLLASIFHCKAEGFALAMFGAEHIATPSRQQELRTTPLLSDAPVDGWGWAPKKPSPRSKAELRYTDPYIGLASAVLKHTYHPAPITNFPGLLTHVNASTSGETYLQTPRWASNFGMIYSEDLTFIVQSGPYGPSPRAHPCRRIPLLGHPPSRRELLASLPVSANTNGRSELKIPEFACSTRTLFTFEVACAAEGKEDGCYLKFVQDNKSRELGLFLTQYAVLSSDGENDENKLCLFLTQYAVSPSDGENNENNADARSSLLLCNL